MLTPIEMYIETLFVISDLFKAFAYTVEEAFLG